MLAKLKKCILKNKKICSLENLILFTNIYINDQLSIELASQVNFFYVHIYLIEILCLLILFLSKHLFNYVSIYFT